MTTLDKAYKIVDNCISGCHACSGFMCLEFGDDEECPCNGGDDKEPLCDGNGSDTENVLQIAREYIKNHRLGVKMTRAEVLANYAVEVVD